MDYRNNIIYFPAHELLEKVPMNGQFIRAILQVIINFSMRNRLVAVESSQLDRVTLLLPYGESLFFMPALFLAGDSVKHGP